MAQMPPPGFMQPPTQPFYQPYGNVVTQNNPQYVPTPTQHVNPFAPNAPPYVSQTAGIRRADNFNPGSFPSVNQQHIPSAPPPTIPTAIPWPPAPGPPPTHLYQSPHPRASDHRQLPVRSGRRSASPQAIRVDGRQGIATTVSRGVPGAETWHDTTRTASSQAPRVGGQHDAVPTVSHGAVGANARQGTTHGASDRQAILCKICGNMFFFLI